MPLAESAASYRRTKNDFLVIGSARPWEVAAKCRAQLFKVVKRLEESRHVVVTVRQKRGHAKEQIEQLAVMSGDSADVCVSGAIVVAPTLQDAIWRHQDHMLPIEVGRRGAPQQMPPQLRQAQHKRGKNEQAESYGEREPVCQLQPKLRCVGGMTTRGHQSEHQGRDDGTTQGGATTA